MFGAGGATEEKNPVPRISLFTPLIQEDRNTKIPIDAVTVVLTIML